jgi:hypothetical protein
VLVAVPMILAQAAEVPVAYYTVHQFLYPHQPLIQLP